MALDLPRWSGWALLAALVAIPVILLIIVASRPELPRRTRTLIWGASAVSALLLVAALVAMAALRAWMEEIIRATEPSVAIPTAQCGCG